MSYRFVFGASGSGKSYVIKKEMVQRSKSALDHLALAAKMDRPASDGDAAANYLYVVPDQFTMQSQKDLVLASGDQGILNIDVLSFGRLSHRIFEELGAPDRTPLDDVGKSLILRRVAAGITHELPVLGGRMGRLGMIAEVKSMISEFMQYDLDVDGVRDLGAYALAHGQGALAARLQDLARLYEAFLQYEADRYMTGEETLDLLAEMIPQSRWIADSAIVFDGFTGFTPVQYRVVKALLQTAREVTFVLTIGEDGGPTAVETLDKDVPIDPQDLFYLTRHTVRSIMRVAQEAGVPHGEDIDLAGTGIAAPLVHGARTTGSDSSEPVPATQRSAGLAGAADALPRFGGTPALAHLEQALFRYPVRQRDSADGRVQIYQSSTPEEEVREMCIRIRQLVREQGYAYRDVSIVCGDLAAYEDALGKMAQVYELPIYIDRTQAVLRNPLTESIRGALEVAGGDYSYDTMFRYLRAGLTSLTTEEIDRLENYALARGIRTKRQWTVPFEEYAEGSAAADALHLNDAAAADESRDADAVGGGPVLPRSVEAMRETLMRELEPLLGRSGKTAGERTRALYAYLVGVKARERMFTYAARFAGQEDHVRRQEYEQIYHAIIALLDQIYELIGDEEISAEDYLEILETGFEEIRLGVLPQRADRILAGDMERSRLPECKVLFFLGANDGNVPKGTSRGGLISDLDREFLAGSDAELSPTPREQMYLQRLYLYLNLTKASDRLVISYTQTKADGSSVRPSYLVSTIRQMYGDLVVELPERYETPSAMADRLVGPVDALQFLAGGIRQYADGMYESDPALDAVFQTVYGYTARRIEGVSALTAAAFRRYRPHPISKATAEALYGRILGGSVTRLETAAECMLRHYLQYGLRLKEREERRFESRDAGSILHEAIQTFSEMIRDRGMDWQTFTPAEGMALADEAYEAATTGYDHGLVEMDARTRAASERMRRMLYRTIETLQYQIQHGAFVPTLFEASFDGTAAMRFDLGDGRGVRLRGRIDRVDLCEQDGKVYIKIIDYKSGHKDIDLSRIEMGLQLQLPLYMDAEMDVQRGLHPGEEIVPAGMLYYQFDNPILTGKDATAAVGSWLAAAIAAQAGGLITDHGDGAAQETVGAQTPPGGDANVGGTNADDAMPGMDAGTSAAAGSGSGAPRCVAAEEAIHLALRPTGRVNDDPAVLALLDATLDASSTVIPVKYNKGGGLAASSKTFSNEEFEEVFRSIRGTICRLAGEILDGSDRAEPVDYGSNGRTSCTYCAFKDVCGFDRKLPGYDYRKIPKVDKKADDKAGARSDGKVDTKAGSEPNQIADTKADGRPTGRTGRGSDAKETKVAKAAGTRTPDAQESPKAATQPASDIAGTHRYMPSDAGDANDLPFI